MTTYNFSSLTNGSLQAFIAGTDQLVLDTLDTQANSVAIALGSLDIVESAAGVTFSFGGKTVTLTGVTVQDLVGSTIAAGTGNVQYDGTVNLGILQFGDNTLASPDAGQHPVATNADDFFLGGDGADVFNGQQGNDHILGGGGTILSAAAWATTSLTAAPGMISSSAIAAMT